MQEPWQAVRLVLGIILLVVGFCMLAAAMQSGAAFAVPFALPPTVVGAILLHPWISAPVARAFSGLVYPTGGRANYSEQFTKARTLLVECRYEEAAAELRLKLADNPGSVDGTILLATVLAEHLDASAEAIDMLREALDCAKWQPGRERLVMLAVDLLLERGEHGVALGLLERNLRVARDDKPARTSLSERLEYLRKESEST